MPGGRPHIRALLPGSGAVKMPSRAISSDAGKGGPKKESDSSQVMLVVAATAAAGFMWLSYLKRTHARMDFATQTTTGFATDSEHDGVSAHLPPREILMGNTAAFSVPHASVTAHRR